MGDEERRLAAEAAIQSAVATLRAIESVIPTLEAHAHMNFREKEDWLPLARMNVADAIRRWHDVCERAHTAPYVMPEQREEP